MRGNEMLLEPHELYSYLNPNTVKGILHIGAHLCEEKNYYNNVLRVVDDKIIWVEGSPEMATRAKHLYPNSIILQALCSEKDGEVVDFMLTSNAQESSSILEFGTHTTHHPHVKETGKIKLTTTTIDTLLEHIDTSFVNFINIDVQGAEKLVLSGATKILEQVDYIYAEMNTEEVYKGCCLLPDFDAFLANFGFKRASTKMTQFIWGDALYVKS